jgi:hypothetical protein
MRASAGALCPAAPTPRGAAAVAAARQQMGPAAGRPAAARRRSGRAGAAAAAAGARAAAAAAAAARLPIASRAARRGVACRVSEPAGAARPFTEEELRQLGSEDAAQGEAALGQAWREQFSGDLEGLYDYVDRRVQGAGGVLGGWRDGGREGAAYGPARGGSRSRRGGAAIPTRHAPHAPLRARPTPAGTRRSGCSACATRWRCRAPCASARARSWTSTACPPAWRPTSSAWAPGGCGVRRAGGGGSHGGE